MIRLCPFFPMALLAAVLSTVAPDALAVDFSKDSVDFFQGPLVNDGRVVGLGGAYVSIAEGVAGHLVNPAAFAVRPADFANKWFDWDIGVSSLAAVGGNIDLDMSGKGGRGDKALATQAGANLKFGRFGVGLHGVTQNYQLAVGAPPTDGTAQPRWQIDQSYGGFGFAWAFADGAWVAGVVIGTANATLTSPRKTDPIAKFATALHPSTFGLLWAPRGQRYRLGASLRLAQQMLQDAANHVTEIGGLSVPASVHMPTQFTLGGSWMFGDRQTNIRPTYGAAKHRSGSLATGALRRHYALISADMLVIGTTEHGIGARAYLDGKRQVAGDSVLVGARVGFESEVLPNRLQLRTGVYFEPNRFADSIGRMHWTSGGDVRVYVYWDWRVNVMVDVAPDYQNISLGVGLWH